MNKLDIGGDNHGHITQNRVVNIIISSSSNKTPSVIPCVIAVVLLCVAPFIKEPYGFFAFLRIVTCGALGYAFFYIRDAGLKFIVVSLIALYNPAWPICLSHKIWNFVDISTAIILVTLYSFIVIKNKKQLKKSKIGFQEDKNGK